MKVHFISIGGSIMHNMAIAFRLKGFDVSGSDDEIFEPAKSRLLKSGILPEQAGWFPEKIKPGIDAIILGMHAKDDNPELVKARELGLKIYSFPEFIYQNSLDKKRIVIAGSHGKTTITSMVMHVLARQKFNFDYLVGSQVPGFENSVRISEDAPFIVIEGDEYLSSALDKRPKFLWYKPQLALISGIAWDHVNVFPTWEIYKQQFSDFIDSMEKEAQLVWNSEDKDLAAIVSTKTGIRQIPYSTPAFRIENGRFLIKTNSGKEFMLHIFGSHNLANLEGAKAICMSLGISEDDFYASVVDFRGAGKRLELMFENETFKVFRDFAHAPSKVAGTINGIRLQFPKKKIIACLELHTYSSMNSDFIPQYKNSTHQADLVYLFLNEEAAKIKGMKLPQPEEIKTAFNDRSIRVFYDKNQMELSLLEENYFNSILLLMSSGSFDNWEIPVFIKKIII